MNDGNGLQREAFLSREGEGILATRTGRRLGLGRRYPSHAKGETGGEGDGSSQGRASAQLNFVVHPRYRLGREAGQ